MAFTYQPQEAPGRTRILNLSITLPVLSTRLIFREEATPTRWIFVLRNTPLDFDNLHSRSHGDDEVAFYVLASRRPCVLWSARNCCRNPSAPHNFGQNVWKAESNSHTCSPAWKKTWLLLLNKNPNQLEGFLLPWSLLSLPFRSVQKSWIQVHRPLVKSLPPSARYLPERSPPGFRSESVNVIIVVERFIIVI